MNRYFTFMILLLLSMSCNSTSPTSDQWTMMDEILQSISEPVFPDKSFNIIDFGAFPDGKTLCTEAISKAISACHTQGGGTVLIPNGTFLTGALRLLSNVRLHLSDEATLFFSVDPKDYLPLVYTRWEGIDCYNYSPLIYAIDAENIAITGKGILEGNASQSYWWPWKGLQQYGWKEGMPSQLIPSSRPMLDTLNKNRVPVENRMAGDGYYLRPQFIQPVRCKNILIQDVVIENSPFWVIHPLFCENMIVQHVTINSLGPNNDGCDPESCKNLLIDNCYFNTGDDCIAIKSGRNQDGIAASTPTENVIIRNCVMKEGHGGVVIGSEASGGARNIFVENCQMDSPNLDRAIRIKSNSNRSGIIENLFARTITIGQVSESVLHINLLYDIIREGTDTLYPQVRNIFLENISCLESRYGVYIQGIEGQNCISGIHMKNCRFDGVKQGNRISDSGEIEAVEVYINGEISTIK